jgi:hypothetical protein
MWTALFASNIAGARIMTHTKRGGIHFISIGRLRVSWCWKRKSTPTWTQRNIIADDPYEKAVKRFNLEAQIRNHVQRQFTTYTPDERNIFGGFLW